MKFRSLATIYILFVFFVPKSISPINMPGFPILSASRIYYFVWLIIFLVVFIKRKTIRKSVLSYPFFKPMYTIMLSMLVVTMFAQNVGASVSVMLGFFIESFLLGLMIWVAYNKPDEITYILRRSVLIFVVLAVYGTVSYFLGSNPIMEYLEANLTNESTRGLISTYSDTERLGLSGRAYSIFSHPMQYGGLLVMMLCVSFYLYNSDIGIRKYLNLLYMMILASGIVFTNSRTPIVFLLVIIVTFWCLQNVKEKLKIIYALLFLIIVSSIIANDSTIELVSSIFTEVFGGKSDVAGSSLEMRLMQFGEVIKLFGEAPIAGNGLATTSLMIKDGMMPVDLLNAESALFFQLIDAGVVGVLAHVYFFGFLMIYFLRQKKQAINDDLKKLSLLIASLVLGYVSFILVTGFLDTFKLFIVITTLAARYIWLNPKKYIDRHSTVRRWSNITDFRGGPMSLR